MFPTIGDAHVDLAVGVPSVVRSLNTGVLARTELSTTQVDANKVRSSTSGRSGSNSAEQSCCTEQEFGQHRELDEENGNKVGCQ